MQAFKYFWPSQFKDMTFLEFCTDAATVGVNCDLTADSDEANESDDDEPASGRKRSASSSTKPGSRSPSKKAMTAGGGDDDSSHTLVAISSLKGWVGGRQQQCGVAGCRKRCGFYCLKCSRDSMPTSIKVVHPLPGCTGSKKVTESLL